MIFDFQIACSLKEAFAGWGQDLDVVGRLLTVQRLLTVFKEDEM